MPPAWLRTQLRLGADKEIQDRLHVRMHLCCGDVDSYTGQIQTRHHQASDIIQWIQGCHSIL